MKKYSLVLVILTLALTVGFAFVSCNIVNPDDDPNHDHIWGAWTVTTPATCTARGLETRVCTRNASHTETRSTAALGHSWGSWSVITQPTATKNGMEARTCTRNPSHIETRSVTVTGAPSTPATTPGTPVTTPGTPVTTPGGTTPGTTPGGTTPGGGNINGTYIITDKYGSVYTMVIFGSTYIYTVSSIMVSGEIVDNKITIFTLNGITMVLTIVGNNLVDSSGNIYVKQ
jgi:hypothetical protein